MSTTTTPTPGVPPDLRTAAPVPATPPIELPPDGLGYQLKRRLLGPALHNEQLDEERLGKPTALAVFASDNLSSSAYATEEILRVLVPAIGLAAFSLVVPITLAMLGVLAVLILSYRQTIKAYPTAGGAYMVTRDNFGILPAQVAGVALLTDYVLTVAVSVAAGVAALVSAFSVLTPYSVPVSVALICVIAYGNLAGSRRPAASSPPPPTSSSSTWSCSSASASAGCSSATFRWRTTARRGCSASGARAAGCSWGPPCSSCCTPSPRAAPRSPASRPSPTACPLSVSPPGATLAAPS